MFHSSPNWSDSKNIENRSYKISPFRNFLVFNYLVAFVNPSFVNWIDCLSFSRLSILAVSPSFGRGPTKRCTLFLKTAHHTNRAPDTNSQPLTQTQTHFSLPLILDIKFLICSYHSVNSTDQHPTQLQNTEQNIEHSNYDTLGCLQHGAVTSGWNVSLYIIQDTPPFCPYMVTCRFSVVFILVIYRLSAKTKRNTNLISSWIPVGH